MAIVSSEYSTGVSPRKCSTQATFFPEKLRNREPLSFSCVFFFCYRPIATMFNNELFFQDFYAYFMPALLDSKPFHALPLSCLIDILNGSDCIREEELPSRPSEGEREANVCGMANRPLASTGPTAAQICLGLGPT